ncbi:GNAT family N-acetyltransferase [Sphaerisporangium sp. TRM90804]|uniref:GNAT family N-acetyltransferase n=1 Tax=Sphaerisporangium sp. TRM90804 TaxID=3031113 RepID=UPI00244AE345|nr:GNAT family N-acetyltransferase [Sphaerisporangium sp. TRM90804]MDH2429064.1 GNAT family N-acetyltransferase [Sphaerisporangium sp. TRM90804]
MRISVVHPRELGASETDRWRELQNGDPALDSPFLSPEFTVETGRVREQVRVAVLSDGPDIVGFLPFERHRFGIGMPVAAGLTDAQGMVHAKDVELSTKELMRACGLSVLEFDHLLAGQPLMPAKHSRHPSPVIDLSDGFPAYVEVLKEVSGKTYKSTAYKSRKLQRDFGELRHDYDVRDEAVLRVLLDWKTGQYRRTGRTDRFARPWIVRLVQNLLQVDTPHFGGSLDMVYAGGRPVAGHFGLRTATTLAGWFPAYDTAFAKYSPGLIQHLGMAERAAEAGIRLIDMGRGEKEYKEKLKTGELWVVEGRIARFTPAAGAHWVSRVPLRKARGTVLANSALRDTADLALKTFGKIRTSIAS